MAKPRREARTPTYRELGPHSDEGDFYGPSFHGDIEDLGGDWPRWLPRTQNVINHLQRRLNTRVDDGLPPNGGDTEAPEGWPTGYIDPEPEDEFHPGNPRFYGDN